MVVMRGAPLYVSAPNSTMWAQAYDRHEVNKKMTIEMEELFALWVIEKTKKLRGTEAIPHPSHAQFSKWVSEAWHSMSDDELLSTMRKSIFPNGLELSQLEDIHFQEHHLAHAKPDSDSDFDHDSGTAPDCELLTSDDSSSCSNSGEDEVHIVWAKAGRGIWGLGHVFEGKLYFTKDIVDDNFEPRVRKPKAIQKLEAKPAPKPAPKGKHVQLFKVRRKVGKAFYYTALDALMGSDDLQNLLKNAAHCVLVPCCDNCA